MSKLSSAMMEALCTSGRRGVYTIFAHKQTIDALIRRGYACELLTHDGKARRSARITDAGLAISAERRKTCVTA